MRYHHILIVLFAVFSSSSLAQVPDTLWTRTLGFDGSSGDEIYSVQQTSDGGFIVCGETRWNGEWNDLGNVFYAKIDPYGNIEWQRFINESFYESSYSVKQTTDGGYVIGGINHSEGISGYDMYLIRTNSIGDTLWTRLYGENDDEDLHEIGLTSDGGYFLAGCTNSFASESQDMYLVRVDESGNTIWTREYGTHGAECAVSAKQTADGGFVLLSGINTGQPSYSDYWLVRTDQAGDTLWTRRYNIASAETPTFVDITQDGGFVLAGRAFDIGGQNEEFYVLKTDSQGDTLWTRFLGRGGDDRPTVIRQCSDGGFIVVGQTGFAGDWLAIKLSSDGDSLWSYHYGGASSDYANDVSQTSDGGFVIAGTIWHSTLGEEGLVIRLASETVGSIDEPIFTPNNVILHPSYPNPFNSMAQITYEVRRFGQVSLKVYNLHGSEVATLFEGISPAGVHTVSFDAVNLASGVYLCRLSADNLNETVKLVLIK